MRQFIVLALSVGLVACGVSEGVPTAAPSYIPQVAATDPTPVPTPLPTPAPVFPTPAQPPPYAPGSAQLDVMIHESPGSVRVVFGTSRPEGAARWVWVESDGTVNETNVPQFARVYVGTSGERSMEVRILTGQGDQLASATASYRVRAEPWQFVIAADTVAQTDSVIYVALRVVNAPAPGHVDRYVWTFGDGDSTNTPTEYVTHPYRQQGDYTVTVKALSREPERNLIGSGSGIAVATRR